jgi:hypothetical protein
MPYLKAAEVERLTLPSDPEYWVELKCTATYADRKAAQTAMLEMAPVDVANLTPDEARLVTNVDQASGRGVLTRVQVAAYDATLLLRLLVRWNLTDENGQELPITQDSINRLAGEDGEFLEIEARKRLRGRTQEQEGPFDTRSLPPSTGSRSSTRRPVRH